MNELGLAIDHLVVAAPTLADGVAWCEATLGIHPGPGGRHALMGTHNRLFGIGTPMHPQAYFEIIAIDPDAPVPQRVRWFDIDRRAGDAPVQLVHVVMNTPDVAAARQAFVDAGLDPGPAVAAERASAAGLLRWRITVRDDGALLCGGALPTLIEWQGPHPSAAMPASGVQLQSLRLRGLPAVLAAPLRAAGLVLDASPGPALSATLATPRGAVELNSL